MARVQFDGDDADGHGIFYHTKRTCELDELLGDVYHKILGELVQRSFGLFTCSLVPELDQSDPVKYLFIFLHETHGPKRTAFSNLLASSYSSDNRAVYLWAPAPIRYLLLWPLNTCWVAQSELSG